MRPDLLPVAQFVGVFGIHGELKIRPSSAGEDTIVADRTFFLDPEGKRSVVPTMVHRRHKRIIVKLSGVESVEAAQLLVGTNLYLPREHIPLREFEYLDQDLIGMSLYDTQGQPLGRTVRGVEHYPAQDCLLVEPGHVLIPLVRAFVRKIDLVKRCITIMVPEGLLDSDRAET
jgi:16S rRNA processing protein RimM